MRTATLPPCRWVGKILRTLPAVLWTGGLELNQSLGMDKETEIPETPRRWN